MAQRRIRRLIAAGLMAALASAVLAGAAAAGDGPAASPGPVDLSGPFHTRSPWRLVITEGPPTKDYADNPAPGAVWLCLERAPGGPCAAEPAMPPPRSPNNYEGWEPHYLRTAEPVYPRGRSAPPLLMIVTASLHAGDGGQAVVTQLLKYDRASDAFERVYARETGTNNNEEVRFIADGPLRGDVIVAEPTDKAPYGYWIEVSAPTPGYAYRRVLRYRSATRYGDGNPLAVIDSEMPAIQLRLGLWRPGAALPLPAGACPKPRLARMELWCD